MGGLNYYLVTALPALGDLGTPPPLTPAQLLEHVEGSSAADAVAAVLLHDDLLQREAVLAGEVEEPTPAVLTREQLRDEQPLPDELAPAGELHARAVAADGIWEAYFRHTANVAARTGIALLGEWTGYEVALRNALVQRRARALELDPSGYLVAEDLAADMDFTATLNEWAAAGDPLAGQQVLDRGRADWIATNGRWFSFADDELVAYAARLMLLTRWQRITAAREQAAANAGGAD